MASPTVAARTETQHASSTTLTIAFTQTTGDRVVIFLGVNDTARTLSTVGDGFTDLTAASATFHILTKVLDGSEGGDVAVTVAVATKGASLAYNIAGHNASIAPEFSVVATGTDTGPNPDTVTPTGGAKDYLWLAAFRQNGEEADDDTWTNSAPTNFGNLIQKTSGTGGLANTNGSVAAADFASNAASQNPDVFNTDQSLAWRAYTVAVHPTTAIDRTTTDAISLSDVAGRTGTYLRSAADSATLGDVPTRAGTFLRSVTDAIGLADIANQVKTLLRTTSDAIGLSDAAGRAVIVLRTVSDALSLTDVATQVKSLLRTAADAIGLSDVATRSGGFLRAASDTLSLADVATRIIATVGVVGSIPPAIRSALHAIARGIAASDKPRGTGG